MCYENSILDHMSSSLQERLHFTSFWNIMKAQTFMLQILKRHILDHFCNKFSYDKVPLPTCKTIFLSCVSFTEMCNSCVTMGTAYHYSL